MKQVVYSALAIQASKAAEAVNSAKDASSISYIKATEASIIARKAEALYKEAEKEAQAASVLATKAAYKAARLAKASKTATATAESLYDKADNTIVLIENAYQNYLVAAKASYDEVSIYFNSLGTNDRN